MKSKTTFTKKDLVVVLGCIVFLLANIAAIGEGGRKRAKAAVCQSNLKQWIQMLSLYADDNDGSFPPGWWAPRGMWMTAMRSYYQDHGIRLCPMATKLQSDGHRPGTFVAWGIYGASGYYSPFWADDGDYGSYGMNGWMCNPPDDPGIPVRERAWYWRNTNVGGKAGKPSNIPTFCDSIWDGTNPRPDDTPPDPPGSKVGRVGMWNYAIPRHGNKGDSVNVCFLDGSVRKTSLKCLWRLRWHKRFQTDYPVEWPKSWNYIREDCE